MKIKRLINRHLLKYGRIFISYKEDPSLWQSVAIWYGLYHVHHRDVFHNAFNMVGGEDWESKLYAVIKGSRFFVPIFAQGSLTEATGQTIFIKEIKCALKENRWIVPVQFGDFKLTDKENKEILNRLGISELTSKHIRSVGELRIFNEFMESLHNDCTGHSDIVERELKGETKKEFTAIFQQAYDRDYQYAIASGQEDIASKIMIRGGTLPVTASSDSFGISKPKITSLPLESTFNLEGDYNFERIDSINPVTEIEDFEGMISPGFTDIGNDNKNEDEEVT